MALAFAAPCASAADEPARWYVQVDNDVVFGTDRWYSSGVRLARVARHGEHEYEFGLIHEVYVPEARNYEPGISDRSPAARLLFSGARHTRDEKDFETLELTLGVRGPAALGRQLTDFIHRAIPAYDVDWSRQYPNQFDAAAGLASSHWAGPFRVHYGAVVGTQMTFAHVGGEWRIGPGSRGIDFQVMRFAATPPFAATAGSLGWSAFLGVSGRGVARNAIIGRNYDPGGEDIRLNGFVGRLAGGIAWTFHDASLTFALVHDTREFREQRKPQDFGSLLLHWNF